jgi:hypothetical protein
VVVVDRDRALPVDVRSSIATLAEGAAAAAIVGDNTVSG